MSDLEQAFQLIDEYSEDADFEGVKSDELLGKAEKVLGLTFPPTYRRFLQRLGCGDIAGMEFYGLVTDNFENSSVPDAIWLTLKHRQVSKLPESLVLVSSTGDGGYHGIDISRQTDEGDSPVVEWWPGQPNASGNGRIVANDFGAFFLNQVKEAIA